MWGRNMVKPASSISEMYVVQYLLQNTRETSPPLVWYDREYGGFVATVSGVHLELGREHSIVGSRVMLTLSRGTDRVYISEPPVATLGGRYRSEDHRRLAEMMKDLERVVLKQCASRRNQSSQVRDRIKNGIFRQLLFNELPE